jgi:hypothetical protein
LAKVHGIGLPDLATMALVDSVVSEEMLQFQKALVRLGVTLVDAFGKSLAKSDECLELALNDSVNIDEGSLEALELSLVSALITLHALDSEDGLVGRADESRLEKAGEAFGPPPFQSSHIVFKLVGLSYLLLGAERFATFPERFSDPGGNHLPQQYRREFKTFRITIDDQGLPRSATPTLDVDTVEWVTGLLWYALRYGLPIYPSSEELAFELSLISRWVHPPSGELAQAAEQEDYVALVPKIATLFRFYDSGYDRPLKIHRRIAEAMVYCYGVYKEGLRSGFQAKSTPERVASGIGIDPPVAFTTNFDCGLERAFDDLGVSYHVVYPIVERPSHVQKKTGGTQSPKIEWVLKTVCHNVGTGDIKQFSPNYRVVLSSKKFPDPASILGPIIVKLHGSPVDSVGGPDLQFALAPVTPDSQLYHFLILPETVYLEALLQQEAGAIPAWVDAFLQNASSDGHGALWFLGYSMSDWNIRLQVYRQARSAARSATRLGPASKSEYGATKYAIVPYIDVFRWTVLTDMDVEICTGDLGEFADKLDSAFLELGLR